LDFVASALRIFSSAFSTESLGVSAMANLIQPTASDPALASVDLDQYSRGIVARIAKRDGLLKKDAACD
jgi:hypothetical protein